MGETWTTDIIFQFDKKNISVRHHYGCFNALIVVLDPSDLQGKNVIYRQSIHVVGVSLED